MHNGFESVWFLFTVAPVVVLSFRTNAARHKARESERAWKLAERYII
jgi:hypothetical protein